MGIVNAIAHKKNKNTYGDFCMGLALGQYLKSTRISAKMSAMALSKASGISKSYLNMKIMVLICEKGIAKLGISRSGRS